MSETKIKSIEVVKKEDLKLDIYKKTTKYAKIKCRKLNFYFHNQNEVCFSFTFNTELSDL